MVLCLVMRKMGPRMNEVLIVFLGLKRWSTGIDDCSLESKISAHLVQVCKHRNLFPKKPVSRNRLPFSGSRP